MKRFFFVTNNIFKEQEIRNFFLSNQSQKFNILSLTDIDFRNSIPEFGNFF
ncbi:Maf family protein [Blattabacterium cuenoti]|uniref:hypothetical protein n=1 Tax=Blattabacterium cuenoti TaxID=1653831 RepID=UPI001EEA2145|nr:hypothetical protein [Blattabacterium cuenoti]